MVKLFDEENGMLLLDEEVQKRESYKKVMSDYVVTRAEVMEQAHLVVNYLKQADARFSEEDKELLSNILCEAAVLYEIANQCEEQEGQYGSI